MTHYRLALVGFGNVGQALARLLLRKQDQLKTQYDVTFSVTGIFTGRHGAAIDPQGLPLEQAVAAVRGGGMLDPLSAQPAPHTVPHRPGVPSGVSQRDAAQSFRENGVDFIRACPADVLFENTPVNHHTGQPAIDHLKAGLEAGMHVVTANKGPVVHGYRLLKETAERRGRQFRFESTVMDGAPIFSLFRETLTGADLAGFRGILNSCTNLILNRMEQGETFDQAVAYAQSIGIAETDPSADVDGWDAAIKVAALATVLMDIPMTPQQVDRRGIREITPQMLSQARQEGKRWKLVCSAHREGNSVAGKVAPEMVSPDSPLYSINGTSSYAQFEMDVLPGLGIVESNPSPETTAFGLLADFLNVVRVR